MSLGARLKAERKRLRLTQIEMAEACGISRWAQLYFEKDINVPGGAYLLAAYAAGVDVMYVLLGQPSKIEPAALRLLTAFDRAPASTRESVLSLLGVAQQDGSR
ncbi:transcriptional regulator [Xanthomonas perforans]|uniref:transcriptional regulator n=1 Tax=Xanthomonas perforans TaxID=442694 RepID=UPI00069C823E|nr:transcriptional regulator [Xanthomonas perforans]MBZ2436261.1 transcriptional regulator [Xanthomonas perforans]MBZ2461374.1 transcriptional regulator [Xanthomonas perforans]MBZ2482800.1 transcriptional regulator [Xanthomonas perforans]MBZ2491368.1 transcriptional regulator [Xanthomonas perforans]MBZ2495743.1 transcriptional regulator [Xanthomonas perforans]